MKNIKLRIVYLILCSALLLFALFMLAVNLIIPAHFVREAKKALISEAQYQNRTIPYTDDGSFFDDEWNDAEEHFLTPSIVFLELDNANQSSGWNRDAYRLEKKLLEYCKGRDLSLNQCYTFKTDRHHLIFMSVQEEQDDWETPYAYIMYIDIGPITRYIVTLNWAFFGVLLAISSVMCLLGFRFGRDIEKEAERQQTFFQNASHELKTPLAAIRLLTDSILQTENIDRETAREFVTDIGQEAERLSRITEDLLRLTRLDSNVLERPVVVDALPVLEQVMRMMSLVAQEKGAELTYRAEGTCTMLATRDEIHQIIYNLTDNAVKYTPPGSTVQVSLFREGDQVVLTVEDNGAGIPEEDLPRIFERFYRVDKARSRAAGGTGLGLAIVRDTVEKRGGTVEAANRPGGGAVFTVRWPWREGGGQT